MARALAAKLSISVTAAAVLTRRGHIEPDRAQRFLEPRLAELTSPTSMRDRNVAVDRIARAVRAREKICVFGDYDADGITSAAIVSDVVRTLGGEVVTLLADRFGGGYGLSDDALARVRDTGATLLVTCDCGSSDHERLERARVAGVDAVVIDHHRVPPEPLPALAFLNPHRPECAFPYKGLASVGLALSIGAGVRAALGRELDMRKWLDLVAIGTIGDVAPLDGDNRALVRAGLAALGRGERPGTRALAEIAGHTGAAPLTGEDVAFRFAPRINAPGRLAKPDLALALLLATSDEEARALAGEIDLLSQRRKEIDRALLAEASAMLEDPALAALPVVVLGKEGWHQGVVGIVAGRLASRTGKPTIVIGFDGASGRGSVRGPAGFPLYDALARCKDVLLGFGGHQAAAGVHVDATKLERLRESFASACAALGATPEGARVRIEAEALLDEDDDPARVQKDLERLEPCGQMNPAALLGVASTRVVEAREVRGGHLKLTLAVGRATLSCFGFEMGTSVASLPRGAHANVVGRLRRDTYRGGGAVEMRVESVESI
jgi:single-stranded-DNA-specific exonuclease